MDFNDLSDEDKLIELKHRLDNEEFYLKTTSNPMKLKHRYRDIKDLKRRIKELEEKIKQ